MKEERILAYKKKNYEVKKTSIWKRLSLLKPSAEPANVPAVTLAEIPEYTGDAYVTVNQNVPQFSEEELRDYDCKSFNCFYSQMTTDMLI